jgi:hypothetical protein
MMQGQDKANFKEMSDHTSEEDADNKLSTLVTDLPSEELSFPCYDGCLM